VNRVPRTVATESPLQRALDCGELIELYQPVVRLSDGTAAHVEALLRWEQPDRSLLAPRDFLVGEDDAVLLVRIGWSVVIEAARRAGAWRAAHPERPIAVAVNLFDEHLERRDLPTRIKSLLAHHRVAVPGGLAFEVGEHHLDPPRSRTTDRLTMLRNLGVVTVVDDFGAALAATDLDADELRDRAIARLDRRRTFPLDVVKFDPGFVRRLETDENLRAVIDVAHAVDLVVAAMSIEDRETADRAERVGFDLAQGFHFARPQRPEQIELLLRAG
jgi:EAL domain-containing protein (putative c-di-GMP-specific phosphodiesterase class I)